MGSLVECLETCVRQSTFDMGDSGRIGWSDVRQLHQRRRWTDLGQPLLDATKVEVPKGPFSDLREELLPVLAGFLHEETGRIGNGLHLITGGLMDMACPTLGNFAKLLIRGAAGLGSERVVELLVGWVSGEPIRLRMCALLEGADVDGHVSLQGGVHLEKLPLSSSDLPASLPFRAPTATVSDYMGGVVLSVDCEMSPSLYVPTDEEVQWHSHRTASFKLANGQLPHMSLDSFCGSMSLACGGYVDWFLQWWDHGDLGAFDLGSGSVNYKYRSGRSRLIFSQGHMNVARQIHQLRYSTGGPRDNLELAIRRWIRSMSQTTDSDKLIELRIALEALYEIGGLNEKGFRIATYGAWHLGNTFEERCKYRETLRNVYDDSSRAIHAGKLKHAAKNRELVSDAQNICRDGILKRLREAEAPKWDELILGKGA